jgi:4-hydroxy-3-methylbut-2-enyl diphosphate reductase IspH
LREQKYDEKWMTLFEKQDKKNKIEREKTEAAKIKSQTTMIKADAARIKAILEPSLFGLKKMKEE